MNTIEERQIEQCEDAHLSEFWKWFIAPLNGKPANQFAPPWTHDFMSLSLDNPRSGPWRLRLYYGDLGVSLGRGPKVEIGRVDESGMEGDDFIFADEQAFERAQFEVDMQWFDIYPENAELQERFIAGGPGWL